LTEELLFGEAVVRKNLAQARLGRA
jgi:hypothetical protein